MLPNTEPLTITGATTSKVILVVEDDDANAEVLVQVLLQETPYQVYLATDGTAALQFISHIKPDLFILDYRLPGMNGIELYDSLHTHGEFKETPVLILSACLECYQEEIGSHKLLALAKPFDVDDLLSLIEEVLAHSSDRSSQQLVPVDGRNELQAM
jgi:CheY-like chemotaxis protein